VGRTRVASEEYIRPKTPAPMISIEPGVGRWFRGAFEEAISPKRWRWTKGQKIWGTERTPQELSPPWMT